MSFGSSYSQMLYACFGGLGEATEGILGHVRGGVESADRSRCIIY